MYKPPPRAGADQGHQEERTPQQGPIMARSPNNPTKGPPGSTKGKHHKTATKQNPKGPTSNDLTTRLFGIDFWHAVEFSKIKRTPPQTFRPAVGATVQTYPIGRRTVNFAASLERLSVSVLQGDRWITPPG